MRYIQIVLLACFVINGCASSSYQYNTIRKSHDSSIPYDFTIGDEVKIWTEKTGEVRFKVEKITETTVSGEGIEIPFRDIQGASKKELDEWQTGYSPGEDFWTDYLIFTAVIGAVLILGLTAL